MYIIYIYIYIFTFRCFNSAQCRVTVIAHGGLGLLINFPAGNYHLRLLGQLSWPKSFAASAANCVAFISCHDDVRANGRAGRELLLLLLRLLLLRELCLSADEGTAMLGPKTHAIAGCMPNFLPPHLSLFPSSRTLSCRRTKILCVCQNVRDFDFDFVAVRC